MSSLPATISPQADKDPLTKMFEVALPRIEAALPAHIGAQRMVQVVLAMRYGDQKLRQCVPASVLACVMRAASFGWELDKCMQESFLIPRKNKNGPKGPDGRPTEFLECTLMAGYQGIRKLAMESDKIGIIETFVIREGDDFSFERTDAGPILYHRPDLFKGGRAIGFGSCARLTNGMNSYEFMNIDQIEHVMMRSESFKWLKDGEKPDGPWVTDFDEMARKTVLKRHCKTLPRSVKLAQAIELDDEMYARRVEEREQKVKSMGTEGLKNRLMPPKPPDEPPAALEDDEVPLTEEEMASLKGKPASDESWHEGRK